MIRINIEKEVKYLQSQMPKVGDTYRMKRRLPWKMKAFPLEGTTSESKWLNLLGIFKRGHISNQKNLISNTIMRSQFATSFILKIK